MFENLAEEWRAFGKRGKTPGTQVQHRPAQRSETADFSKFLGGPQCRSSDIAESFPEFCPRYLSTFRQEHIEIAQRVLGQSLKANMNLIREQSPTEADGKVAPELAILPMAPPDVAEAPAGTPTAPNLVHDPRRPRRGLWALLALPGAGIAAWLLLAEEHRPAPQATSQAATLTPGEFGLSDNEIKALRIEPVQLGDFHAVSVAEGRIAYNEDRSTPVFPPYNGRVVRALARLGEQVQAGGTLFEIETTDLAGAANDLLSAVDSLNKARATMAQAKREEQRQGSLFAARAGSARDVEQARVAALGAAADLRSAEATLAATRDKLRVLGRSTEQIQRIEETRHVDAVVPVVAPIAGTVTQRRVGPGQWLSSGAADPVFTISDLSTMWLVAAVRELDAPLIKVGQQVKVTVGALTDRTFDARIVTMGAGLDPATRRLSVRAEVLDPDQLLKPEMFATFHIALGEVEQAVSVPAKAVIYKGNQASVWLALENRHFELRTIRTGIRDGEMLAVTEGLQRGAQVVTGGALFIDRAARID